MSRRGLNLPGDTIIELVISREETIELLDENARLGSALATVIMEKLALERAVERLKRAQRRGKGKPCR